MRMHYGWLLCGAGIALSCTKIEEPIPGAENVRVPVQQAWNSAIVTTSNGAKTAEIHFGYMFQFEKEKTIHFTQGIEVDLFNDEGAHVSRAVADSGVLKEDSEDVEAHGHVLAISDSGMVLKTERIFWNNKNQKWYSDAPTMYVPAAGDTVYSTGFEADRNFKNYKAYQLHGVSQRKINLQFDERLKPKRAAKDSVGAAADSLSILKDIK